MTGFATFVSATVALSSMVAAGCSSGGGGTGTGTPTDGGAAGVPAATPTPGLLTGTIRDERGNAITVPGVKYKVSASGVSEGSGADVSYSPEVQPSGSYQATLAAGSYRVSAKLEVVFNKSTYTFELDPVQPNTTDRSSKDGIVQDFVWKLSGPHFRYAQNPDPTKATNWYGASVLVRLAQYRNDLSKVPEPTPAQTKYTFTFKPQGKVVDGSDAKEKKFERSWDGSRLDNELLNDIPIGSYKLSGIEIAPGGTSRPLIFETSYAKYESEASVDFPYSEITLGPQTHQFAFDR